MASQTMRAMRERVNPTESSLVVPFALWPEQGEAAAWVAQPDWPALPWLQAAMHQPVQVAWVWDVHADAARPHLSLPHEWLYAAQRGWPLSDGQLPWAAQAACDAGLARAGDGSAWGLVSVCHWQMTHGSATLTDPAEWAVDDATDAALFGAMQDFFAQDGLALHRHQPGHWLVTAPHLATLPTASLERVIGQDVHGWWVGTAASPAVDAATVRLWRRLQNEMQMVLYTHPVNAQRPVPINSFWLHGTGALPLPAQALTPSPVGSLPVTSLPLTASPVALPPALQQAMAALHQAGRASHFAAWCQAWRDLDAALAAWAAGHTQPITLYLCGRTQARQLILHPSAQHTGRWRGLAQRLRHLVAAPPDGRRVLFESDPVEASA